MLRTINRVMMTLFPREWRKRASHKRRSEAAKKAWETRKKISQPTTKRASGGAQIGCADGYEAIRAAVTQEAKESTNV